MNSPYSKTILSVYSTLTFMLLHLWLNAQTPCPNLVTNGNFEAATSTGFTSGLPVNCGCVLNTYCVTTNFNLKCPSTFPNYGDNTTGTGKFLLAQNSLAANVWETNVTVTPNAALWIDPALVGVSLANNVELMQVTFSIIGGAGTASNVTISDTPTPFKALDGSLVYAVVESVSGSVEVATVLPVELMDFTGKNVEVRNPATGGTEVGNFLTWTTAHETNTKGFDIERQQGNDWIKIGFVNAHNKASTYQFSDNAPSVGLNYYRLRIVENDGTTKYSKIIAIESGKILRGVKIYPNPTNGILTIELAGQSKANIHVFNLIGQVVLSQKSFSEKTEIDLSALPQGAYWLETQVSGHILREKFVKY